MNKRHQLLEEAGRLKRLSQAKRGDLAWLALTGRLTEVELDHRAAEARALALRAADLEQQAEALPETGPHVRDPVEARRRRRAAILARAGEIRQRETTCRRLIVRERALGAEAKAEFLEGVAAQLLAKALHLEAQANALPAVVEPAEAQPALVGHPILAGR